MAKNCVSMCRDRSVGILELMIWMVDLLSQWSSVGLFCGKPNSVRIERRHLACLAARTAAKSLASVDDAAVMV